MTEKVDGIRWVIEEIDNKIMELVKQRMDAAVKMGKTKVEKSLPVRNLRVEDEVLDRYAAKAVEAGISEEAAREIAQILMRESIEVQARLPRPMKYSKNVLVIGGAGSMGLWFSKYMSMRGHKVKVLDPVTTKEFPMVKDLGPAVKQADVIIVAVPISQAQAVLEDIAEHRPKALIFDIMSIKAPIIPQIRSMAEDGLKICSIHPMFGPSAKSMYSRNIVLCDCGSRSAMDEFLSLVDGMGAKVTEMPISEHDLLVSYILGLSHAVNIAFFHTLGATGIEFKNLEDIASTTFSRQVANATRVADESPHLYFEIQHENPYTEQCLDLFEKKVHELKEAALAADQEQFVKIMMDGRKYFGGD